MKSLSTYFVEKFLERKIITEEKAEICREGLDLIIADLINFSAIFLVGILFKSIISACLYLLMFWTVRRFSGGFHAKTYWLCRIVTIGTYVLIILIEDIVQGHYIIISLICCIFSLITMIAFAPIRHPNKELTLKEVKANKLFAVLTTLSFSVVSIVLAALNIKVGVVISIILSAISILMYVGILTNGKEEN